MAISDAKKKANRKYDAEHMTQIGLKMKHEERDIYQTEADKYNMTVSRYIKKCVKYCIDNNIDISSVD